VDLLAEELRQTMVDNAPTFLAAMDDPRWADLDVAALSRRSVPLRLADGDQSPTFLRVIVTELAVWSAWPTASSDPPSRPPVTCRS
jgi:hypothetical protein